MSSREPRPPRAAATSSHQRVMALQEKEKLIAFNLKTLQKLVLGYAIFYSEVPYQSLAKILAEAMALRECWIENQQGDRKVLFYPCSL